LEFISNFHAVKVSARVRKFVFLRCSGKAFQELSFKKNSTKKYYFSAKLLDVEVSFTLTVLIVPADKFCYFGVTKPNNGIYNKHLQHAKQSTDLLVNNYENDQKEK